MNFLVKAMRMKTMTVKATEITKSKTSPFIISYLSEGEFLKLKVRVFICNVKNEIVTKLFEYTANQFNSVANWPMMRQERRSSMSDCSLVGL